MNPAPDKMAEAVGNMKRNLPDLIEYHQLCAEIRHKAYQAHIAEGFTEAQALELVKKLW